MLYATVETLHENGKIFIQYNFLKFTEIDKATIYLTVIIAFSRITRVISNITFNKIYLKHKNKLIIILNILLLLSVILMIIGNIMINNILGSIIMGMGFCLLIFVRDPIMIFTKTELVNNCDFNDQEKVIYKFNLSRKIIRGILALGVSLLLLKVKMLIIMFLFAILVTICLLLTFILSKKLYNSQK